MNFRILDQCLFFGFLAVNVLFFNEAIISIFLLQLSYFFVLIFWVEFGGSKIDFFLRKRTKRHTSKFFTPALKSGNFSLLEEIKENHRRHVSTRLGGASFSIFWLELSFFGTRLGGARF